MMMQVFPETDSPPADRPPLTCADWPDSYFADEVELITHMQGPYHGGVAPGFEP